jgi:TPR repeat protein
MGTIFISYRRTDSKHATSRIHDRLRLEFGKGNVFKDVDSIPIGTDFRVVLRDVLSQCRVALVMIGPNWVTCSDDSGARRLLNPTDFVRLELEASLARDIPVVPVLLDGAAPPRPDELPESLQPICYRHAIAIGDDPHFEDDVARLIRGIRQLLEPKPAQQQKPQEQKGSVSVPPVEPTPPPTDAERREQAEADFQRGAAYYFGRGAPKDSAKAREWLEKAAAQEHAGAQFQLGILYRLGSGVPHDNTKAREWFEKAAAQGNAPAQFQLGFFYAKAVSVPQDYVKAREWYEKAAAQGYALAQLTLGALHEYGQGGPVSVTVALEWYHKAAAQGDKDAKEAIARLEKKQ